jgi:hypothetical protein
VNGASFTMPPMSDATLKHLAEGTRALALRDPLMAAKALLKGMEDQTPGAHAIILRFLTQEIKFMNPSPPASAPAGSGGPVAAVLPVAGPAFANPPSPGGSSARMVTAHPGHVPPGVRAERSSRRHR